ncbi:MAG: GIY-YIG nuclease family protein [Patescibacteria group bacterium]|nr:GIY-YIG nuclease family protein [Patescibacteria group bacterium]MDD5294592.1 GIY-YIG nuclease family protein [Patescibacteria group bacterium]MDD5554092.1 GIY-YIG nuclease family protein [Patescibacteria group bacterium]
MIVVYAIYNTSYGEIYVGMTNNLKRRLKEHARGQTKYTRKFSNFNLIFTEEFEDYKIARRKEKYLKSGCGKEFLKTLI